MELEVQGITLVPQLNSSEANIQAFKQTHKYSNMHFKHSNHFTHKCTWCVLMKSFRKRIFEMVL